MLLVRECAAASLRTPSNACSRKLQGALNIMVLFSFMPMNINTRASSAGVSAIRAGQHT